jgi:hypothetical protein
MPHGIIRWIHSSHRVTCTDFFAQCLLPAGHKWSQLAETFSLDNKERKPASAICQSKSSYHCTGIQVYPAIAILPSATSHQDGCVEGEKPQLKTESPTPFPQHRVGSMGHHNLPSLGRPTKCKAKTS